MFSKYLSYFQHFYFWHAFYFIRTSRNDCFVWCFPCCNFYGLLQWGSEYIVEVLDQSYQMSFKWMNSVAQSLNFHTLLEKKLDSIQQNISHQTVEKARIIFDRLLVHHVTSITGCVGSRMVFSPKNSIIWHRFEWDL